MKYVYYVLLVFGILLFISSVHISLGKGIDPVDIPSVYFGNVGDYAIYKFDDLNRHCYLSFNDSNDLISMSCFQDVLIP